MAKKLKVDFSGVSDGGGGFRIPAGDYVVKVKKVEQKIGESSGKPYLNWELEVISGGDKSAKGKVLYHTTSLQPQALFNLRNVLVALGIDIPKKSLEIGLDKLKGKIMGVTVEDDEYRGEDGRKQKKSSIVETFAVKQGKGGKYEKMAIPDEEEFDDEDEDEDDDDSEDDDDDEEEDEDEDSDEDDEDDEDSDDDEDDEDDDEDDEDEDEDDDEDEEEEAPKSKKSSAKKSPPAKKSKAPAKKAPAKTAKNSKKKR